MVTAVYREARSANGSSYTNREKKFYAFFERSGSLSTSTTEDNVQVVDERVKEKAHPHDKALNKEEIVEVETPDPIESTKATAPPEASPYCFKKLQKEFHRRSMKMITETFSSDSDNIAVLPKRLR
ncbi:hypothetical protein TNCV_2124751 [Trichonephila clavipes]|uniref:Uncharacterized protein n=1 Tax=Trichonephila clavipes TaxID=2585209 RepID=A0A8X6UX73_TRICX|nr:hypothetical protein TNCV_2124751 [Trichonephila clavipes]